jgi:hypothetical protein
MRYKSALSPLYIWIAFNEMSAGTGVSLFSSSLAEELVFRYIDSFVLQTHILEVIRLIRAKTFKLVEH